MDILCIKLQLCEIKRFLPMPNIVRAARTFGITSKKANGGLLIKLRFFLNLENLSKVKKNIVIYKVQQ